MKSYHSQRGLSFPIVILSIALLAFLTRSLTALGILFSSLSIDVRRGEEIHEQARQAILSNHSSQVGCRSLPVIYKESSRSWASCSESTSPFSTLPAINESFDNFNYDPLFTSPVVCPGLESETNQQVFSHPTCSKVCKIQGAVRGDLRALSNLEFTSLGTLTPSPSKQLTVATPGYLLAPEGIQTPQDLLLFAGGDMRIALIRNTTSSLVRVTAISAQGEINIERVAGQISLFVIGRATLRAPPTPFIAPFPLLQRRSAAVLGITPY